MDDPDWAKVLSYLYEERMAMDIESLKNKDGIEGVGVAFANMIQGEERLNNLKSLTNLNEDELENIIRYLEQTNLIDTYYTNVRSDTAYDTNITGKELVNFGLTQEGLSMAHQIKTERQRRKTNRRLLYLTAILAVLTGFLIGIEFVEVPTYLL